MRVVRVTPKKMFDNFMQVRRWWPRLPARSTTRIHCTTSCIDYKIGNILDTNERTGTEPKDAPNFSSAVSVVPATALTLYVVMWPVVNVKVLTAATTFLNATQALFAEGQFLQSAHKQANNSTVFSLSLCSQHEVWISRLSYCRDTAFRTHPRSVMIWRTCLHPHSPPPPPPR